MRSAFAKELAFTVSENPRVKLITCDLGYGVFEEFARTYPLNYLNLGITEQATMSLAAGMAAKNYRPFVYSIANFPTFRCLEQVRNDVVAMNLPVTIVSVGAGLGYGKAGYSHFAVEDIAAIRSLGISIYNPSNKQELTEAISQILDQREPAYLRLGGKLEEDNHISRGYMHAEISDVVLAYSGDLRNLVHEAAHILENCGVKVEVISIPVINNLAIDNLLKLKASNLVTIEEHVLSGGFSSFILERLSDLELPTRVKRIGIRKIDPHLVGSHSFLREHYGITTKNIVENALELVGSTQIK